MPIVRIEGIPSYFGQMHLNEAARRVKEIIASIPELKVETSQISVLFPEDILKERSDVEIIATVDGLFKKPERTDKVRQNLANKVAHVLMEVFQQASLVECFVKPFDPKLGFASLSK